MFISLFPTFLTAQNTDNALVLKPGIYDDIVTKRLQEELATKLPAGLESVIGKIEEPLLADYLGRFLAAKLSVAFRSLAEAPIEQIDLANRLLTVASEKEPLAYLVEDLFSSDEHAFVLEELRASSAAKAQRPITSLSSSSLLTGAPGLPQLGSEIELELETSDRCEMLVSFIKSGGLRLMREPLRKFTERGGTLRIITTSYLGASDPTAIEELASLANTEVRINYDTKHARLHAKSYFFVRSSGLSTGYVGSANLSHAAMTSGLEWTIKIAARELPDLFRRCRAEFAGYWENSAFEPYDRKRPERFREAIRLERGDTKSIGSELFIFTLTPHPHQKEVLFELAKARETRGHFRNLVIAATGTGKTMIAAFDYKKACLTEGKKPSLLYVAHRREILEQALKTFRQVLHDGNFGELLVDGQLPASMEYVFCSIQSFTSRSLHLEQGVGRWDYVVVDEAHHAEAKSYDPIIDLLRPKILLGLTATPERTDGSNIAAHFDHPVSAEIRLPDALQDKLLCPFHYFAVSDYTVDFSEIGWRNGRYDESDLNRLVAENRSRAQLVFDKVREYLPDPYDSTIFDRKKVRGLGFCVSVRHATFMADCFAQAGIPSAALTGNTPSTERSALRSKLANGELNFLFVVDVFNEGIDIPQINCVLFLRPTESHVVYLQQLGRGLRHSDEKDYLTVLDFVGQCRREFRFDLRFSALLPGKRHKLIEELERGLPHLPTGCAFQMERQAREIIIESVRRTYDHPEIRIKDAFNSWDNNSPPSFTEFIEFTNEDPIELLRRKSWSHWKAIARGRQLKRDPDADRLDNALPRICLQRAPKYLKWLSRLANAARDEIELLADEPFANLAFQSIWNTKAESLGLSTLKEAFLRLHENPTFIDDLGQVLEWARIYQNASHRSVERVPETLELHGLYSSLEVNAAYQKTTIHGGGSRGTGVVPIHEDRTLIHFVTFEKTDRYFSESTMYRDFPTDPKLLHWESQSGTTQESKTGIIYSKHVEMDYKILFFTRIRKLAAKGITSPFVFLGPGRFIDAVGDRPIAIRWELENPMPIDHYREARQVCGLDG